MGFDRRTFLRALAGGLPAAWAVTAARAQGGGLADFAMPSAACSDAATVTPAVPADATFKPGSPRRASLVDRGMTGTALLLSGVVTGVTCGPIKNAVVDVWQADARGLYDMAGYRLRGHVVTGERGEFELTTLLPGAAKGRAPHLGVRVRPPGRQDFWTELFFAGDSRNDADPRYRPQLALTVTGAGERRRATVTIVLDM
jgi:protocatechuate 3,4-dioxygenase beta subunit